MIYGAEGEKDAEKDGKQKETEPTNGSGLFIHDGAAFACKSTCPGAGLFVV